MAELPSLGQRVTRVRLRRRRRSVRGSVDSSGSQPRRVTSVGLVTTRRRPNRKTGSSPRCAHWGQAAALIAAGVVAFLFYYAAIVSAGTT
jgi:hypothetical protein